MKKLPRLACLNCGKDCKRATTKYCSYVCRAEDFRKKGLHFGGKRRNLPNRTCPQCNKNFWKPYIAECCSPKCMGEYRRDTGRLSSFIQMAKDRTGPRLLSPESRLRMSIAASRRSAQTTFTKGIGGFREDIGHYVRSRWEANICRSLKFSGIDYKYEPTFFILETTSGPITYTPDIKINSSYIEIKGWWREVDKLKKELMRQQFPHINIYYIEPTEYYELEKEFGKLIPNWEFHVRRPKKGGAKKEGGVCTSPSSLKALTT